jgi:predicted nucleic acid-binding protein
LVEIVRGNPRYRRYLPARLHTTLLNLVELYLAILRDRGEEEAKRAFARFRDLVTEVPDDWLFEAMALKLTRPKLSYADAIGYTASRRLDCRFLTGDPAFRRMADVEFRT